MFLFSGEDTTTISVSPAKNMWELIKIYSTTILLKVACCEIRTGVNNESAIWECGNNSVPCWHTCGVWNGKKYCFFFNFAFLVFFLASFLSFT